MTFLLCGGFTHHQKNAPCRPVDSTCEVCRRECLCVCTEQLAKASLEISVIHRKSVKSYSTMFVFSCVFGGILHICKPFSAIFIQQTEQLKLLWFAVSFLVCFLVSYWHRKESYTLPMSVGPPHLAYMHTVGFGNEEVHPRTPICTCIKLLEFNQMEYRVVAEVENDTTSCIYLQTCITILRALSFY